MLRMSFYSGKFFPRMALFAAMGLVFGDVSRAQEPVTTTASLAGNVSQGPRTSPLAPPPDWPVLEAFSKTMTRADFEAALKDIYLEGSPFPPPWTFSPDAVTIETKGKGSLTTNVDFLKTGDTAPVVRRYWRRAEELPPLEGAPLLTGVHIALDAGHIGGAYAKIEERFLSFAEGEAIQEGDLALLTAQVLKPRLEALGARVTLVRESNDPVTEKRPAELKPQAIAFLKEAGIAAPKETYDGITGDAKLMTVQWQSEKLFYRVSEIRARAKKVNEVIMPDVVICLHLNAEAWGDAAKPQFSPLNHLHVVVNGCYSANELALDDVRFEMLRRVFSRAHEVELPLADAVAKGMADATGLPPYVYTTPQARATGETGYVYARNLLANRLFLCPVVYLEPFVMNHQETYRRLLLGHYVGRTLMNGKLHTSAIEDYARGVVNGLVSHYRAKRKP